LLYCIEARKKKTMRKPARLALIDTAPVKMEYRKAFEAEFARRQSGMEVRRMREELAASGLRESDPAEYKQRTFELTVAPYFADPARARNLTPFRVIGRIQQSTWESLGADYDLLPELVPMGFPVLFVHGRDDPIPTASSIEAAKAMNAQIVLLDDCGHVPYVEQPDKLFAALDDFFVATDSPDTSV
jgi:proline iminopeptidase